MAVDVEYRTGRRLRCAQFVDFDNVYLGLLQLDPSAAEAFASDPGRWLGRLEDGHDDEGPFVRRFLVRSCYLNPGTFAKYRPFFTRAGFKVVDCPSLTQQGKSAADINLVLDAVDALSSETHYDEFVIVSADADFTPLALRCRAADRRVTIITAGPAASAYRAVADTVITADMLAELAIAPVAEVVPVAVPEPLPVPAPARTVVEPVAAAAGVSVAPTSAKSAPPVGSSAASSKRAAAEVRKMLRAASGPLISSPVAQGALRIDPTLSASSWDGTGGFAEWLRARVPEAGYASRVPGYVWDRQRFAESDLPPVPAAVDELGLTPFQRQVLRVTDAPTLDATQYGRLLTALSEDLRIHPFDRIETSKRVRDACKEAGVNVGRGSVNFVIQGLLYSGTKLEQQVTPCELADAWVANVVALCRGARMELDDASVAEIRSWMSGGLSGR